MMKNIKMNPTWQTVFGWLAILFSVPLLSIIFIPLWLYKSGLLLFTQYFRPKLRGLLTAYDSIFAIDKYYEHPFAGNITFFILEGQLDIQNLKESFKKSVLSQQCSRLFQIPHLLGGYYFWREIKVDLDKHVRFVQPFQTYNHDEELNTILGELMTAPLPINSGLWELLVYSGFKRNCSVLVFRMHHVLGDGYTFNHIVDLMIGEKSSYLVKNPARTWEEKVQLFASTPRLIHTLYKEGFTHQDWYTRPKTSTTGCASITTLPLETVKLIRRTTKTHFATVGMSLLGGALRRHFLETKSEAELPEFVSIMHSLPRPNHPLGEMVNHWGVGLFKIPLKTTSAYERLMMAETSFNEYIADQYHHLIHAHIPLFSLLPDKGIKLFFQRNLGTSVGFTSIPAFDREAHLYGHRVINMFKVFGLQWSQSAVAAAVYTHNGQMGYSIYANRDIIPDQKGIDRVTKEYLNLELQELMFECGLSRTRTVPRAEGFA